MRSLCVLGRQTAHVCATVFADSLGHVRYYQTPAPPAEFPVDRPGHDRWRELRCALRGRLRRLDNILRLPIAAVIGAAALPLACHPAASSDRAAVLAADSAYVNAWLRNDTTGILETLARDVVLMPANVHALASESAIRALWWPPNGARTRVTAFVRRVDDMDVTGDMPYVRGTDSITFQTDSGASHREQSIHSMTLAVFRKQASGVWLISCMMWGGTTVPVNE